MAFSVIGAGLEAALIFRNRPRPRPWNIRLDELWEIFGPDRLIYGSDWPNSDHWGADPMVLKLVREYFFSKGQAVAEKFFWKNSLAAYRWLKRAPAQP